MAKALIGAGYAVTVVSYRAPVRQLQEICPETEYIEVMPRPITGKLLKLMNGRLSKQQQRRRKRDEAYRRALSRGGLCATVLRTGRSTAAPLRGAADLIRRLLFITPCALVLKKGDQTFAVAWRDLSRQRTLYILSMFVRALHQRATTHAFAAEADRALRSRRFDVVQAHDNYALVAAARLTARDRAKLIYDAVELSSHRLALNLNPCEQMRERLERREEAAILRRADALTTVGEGLADWYSRKYPIRRPLVVRNCRFYWPYEPDVRLRADTGVGPKVRLVVWFGSAYPEQGIELLIRVVPLMAPSLHVAIVATVLPRWVPFMAGLPKLAAELGVADRVHVLPPCEPNDLVPYVSGADLGVIPRPSEHLNNFFSMPNKFLEMVMARLPIAVSRLGDMVDAINKYGIGDVFDERNLTNVAATIERMLEPETYARLRANVMKAAEEMTWEKESVPYVDLVRSMMPAPVPESTPVQDGQAIVAGSAARLADGGGDGSHI